MSRLLSSPLPSRYEARPDSRVVLFTGFHLGGLRWWCFACGVESNPDCGRPDCCELALACSGLRLILHQGHATSLALFYFV